jgi:predicted nucleotidyltransferase
MDKKSALKIIHRLKKILESKNIKLQKIILFGSVTTKTSTPFSDIDVILISDDFQSLNYWQRIEIISGAIYEIFEPIEAFSFTQEEWERKDSFITDYAQNGEIIYSE